MTDEKFQELGFPVDHDQDSSHVSDLVRPPTDSVINNPFITFVSRKYPLVGDPLVSLNHKIMWCYVCLNISASKKQVKVLFVLCVNVLWTFDQILFIIT